MTLHRRKRNAGTMSSASSVVPLMVLMLAIRAEESEVGKHSAGLENKGGEEPPSTSALLLFRTDRPQIYPKNDLMTQAVDLPLESEGSLASRRIIAFNFDPILPPYDVAIDRKLQDVLKVKNVAITEESIAAEVKPEVDKEREDIQREVNDEEHPMDREEKTTGSRYQVIEREDESVIKSVIVESSEDEGVEGETKPVGNGDESETEKTLPGDSGGIFPEKEHPEFASNDENASGSSPELAKTKAPAHTQDDTNKLKSKSTDDEGTKTFQVLGDGIDDTEQEETFTDDKVEASRDHDIHNDEIEPKENGKDKEGVENSQVLDGGINETGEEDKSNGVEGVEILESQGHSMDEIGETGELAPDEGVETSLSLSDEISGTEQGDESLISAEEDVGTSPSQGGDVNETEQRDNLASVVDIDPTSRDLGNVTNELEQEDELTDDEVVVTLHGRSDDTSEMEPEDNMTDKTLQDRRKDTNRMEYAEQKPRDTGDATRNSDVGGTNRSYAVEIPTEEEKLAEANMNTFDTNVTDRPDVLEAPVEGVADDDTKAAFEPAVSAESSNYEDNSSLGELDIDSAAEPRIVGERSDLNQTEQARGASEEHGSDNKEEAGRNDTSKSLAGREAIEVGVSTTEELEVQSDDEESFDKDTDSSAFSDDALVSEVDSVLLMPNEQDERKEAPLVTEENTHHGGDGVAPEFKDSVPSSSSITDEMEKKGVDQTHYVEDDSIKLSKTAEAQQTNSFGGSSAAAGGRKPSVNDEFVLGLDDIHKFVEEVDPPDELDVGAAGSSMQEVLMGQGVQILRKRVSMGVRHVRRTVAELKKRAEGHLGKGSKERKASGASPDGRTTGGAAEVLGGPFSFAVVTVEKNKERLVRASRAVRKACMRFVDQCRSIIKDWFGSAEENDEGDDDDVSDIISKLDIMTTRTEQRRRESLQSDGASITQQGRPDKIPETTGRVSPVGESRLTPEELQKLVARSRQQASSAGIGRGGFGASDSRGDAGAS